MLLIETVSEKLANSVIHGNESTYKYNQDIEAIPEVFKIRYKTKSKNFKKKFDGEDNSKEDV